MAKRKSKRPRRRYWFFLNPYRDAAFTRRPHCANRTSIRKFPLVIHIEPDQLYVLDKVCRYRTRYPRDLSQAGEPVSNWDSGPLTLDSEPKTRLLPSIFQL